MKKISIIIQEFREHGVFKTIKLIKKQFQRRKIRNYKLYQRLLGNKYGIEIGGPSSFFNIEVPIYHIVKALDGVNFSSTTVWEGRLFEGENFKYAKNRIGLQFICDAVDLSRIESEKYDFILSCNNLEHIANPFKALAEFLRIIKPNGYLFLVLPKKDSNFDHNRDFTTLEHLVSDFKNDTLETDLTHLEEILTLHDLSMDPSAGDFENFKKRSIDNFSFRCLHHHVFEMNLLVQIFNYFEIELLLSDYTKTDFIILGRKTK